MLYDPKWEKPTTRRAADLTLADFTAWLERKPATEKYDWASCSHCAVGQFVTDMTGVADPGGHVVYSRIFGGNAELYRAIAGSTPHTFGAALGRARKMAAVG